MLIQARLPVRGEMRVREVSGWGLLCLTPHQPVLVEVMGEESFCSGMINSRPSLTQAASLRSPSEWCLAPELESLFI